LALLNSSSHDPEARYNRKRQTSWVGYKAYLTEAYDDDLPRLITNVETSAAISGGALTPVINRHLAGQGLLPEAHLVDTGFIDAELLVASPER
jgi:transposase